MVAEYLKLPEVARRLDVSEKTARRYVKSGVLPSVFIGNAYRVREEDLQKYLRSAKVEPGKAHRRSPSEPSFNDVLEEERRAEWENAVRSARELRERGQERVGELLAAWRESYDRREDPAERRPYLDEIGELLDEAYDAEMALKSALTARLDLVDLDEFAELQAADRFYVELFKHVQIAGLRRLRIRTDGAQQGEAAHAGQPTAHVVEEREAA